MRVLVIGVMRLGGISKAGNPFDMCQIKALRQSESFKTEKLTCKAFGFESVDLQLKPDAITDFAELVFPISLDLTMEDTLTRKGIESFVTGFTDEIAVPKNPF